MKELVVTLVVACYVSVLAAWVSLCVAAFIRIALKNRNKPAATYQPGGGANIS